MSFIVPIFAWNVPSVFLIFLKRFLVFPILLFFSISLHCSLRKALLSPFAILWNSAFRWAYLSFFPLPFTSFFPQLFASSDNQFALLRLFFLGVVLVTASCTVVQTSSVVLQALCLPDLVPWVCLLPPLCNHRGWIQAIPEWPSGFPYFFSLSLNFAIRSWWSEPQSTPGLVFADCIELYLWLQIT